MEKRCESITPLFLFLGVFAEKLPKGFTSAIVCDIITSPVTRARRHEYAFRLWINAF